MQLLEVEIEKLIWRGRGLARTNEGKVLIVDPPVFPRERVLVQIYKEKKDFCLGRVEQVLISSLRRRHPCEYAFWCGGCTFGHVPSKAGLLLKKGILEDTLQRELKQKKEFFISSAPKNWRYRYRGQVFIKEGKPHYYKLNSKQTFPIKDCLLLDKNLGHALFSLTKNKADGRYTIASSPKGELSIQGDSNVLTFPLKSFPLVYFLSANTFFQANFRLNEVLIKKVSELLSKEEKIADLYGGMGNFALPLAYLGKKVLLVEENKESLELAEVTAKFNQLALKLKPLNLNKEIKPVLDFKPEAAIIDPPRSGAPALARLVKSLSSLKKIIWISCDIVNSLRDLRPFWKQGFELTYLEFLDMFPQTYHLEVIMVLEKN